jgi:hypothetical protein
MGVEPLGPRLVLGGIPSLFGFRGQTTVTIQDSKIHVLRTVVAQMMQDCSSLFERQCSTGIDIKLQETSGMFVDEDLIIRLRPEVESDMARFNWCNGGQAFVVLRHFGVVDMRLGQ